MISKKGSKSITVIMLLDKLPPIGVGGAETQAIRLSKELVQRDVSVIFLTPGRDKIKGHGELEGIPVYRLHSFFNYFWDILSVIKKKTVANAPVQIEYNDSTQRTNEVTTPIVIGVRLRYWIFFLNSLLFLWQRRSRFEIIHVHSMEWPSFVGAWLCKLLKKKLVIKDATMNGINGIYRYPKSNEKLKVIIDQGYFVAMTRAIHQNYLAHGISEAKISLIPNGIDISGPYKLNYSTKNRNVIFVGNLSQQPAKGLDILLKAWKEVVHHQPDARLAIVGDGPLETYQGYLTSTGIHESVALLGKREDVKNLLIDSDIFVLPSRREGMPNALMEAMLIGLPCVGTNISGSQDLINDGVNGLLVPAINTEKLASAILFLMHNQEQAANMGKAARKTICGFNRMEIVANQYIALYKKVLHLKS